MKSEVTDYICDPNNYLIKVSVPTHKVASVVLFIDEKPTLYRKYLMRDLDYNSANKLVEIFCKDLQRLKVKLIEEDNPLIVRRTQETIKKVYNRLGLPIWEKK